MEFEEVNEFIKRRKVNSPASSATPTQVQAEQRASEPAFYYHHDYPSNPKRHAVPGVSKLMNGVRRFKRSHRSRVEQPWNDLTASDEYNYYLHDDTRLIFANAHPSNPNRSASPRIHRKEKKDSISHRPGTDQRLVRFQGEDQGRRRRSSSVPSVTYADIERINEQIEEAMPKHNESMTANNNISPMELIDSLMGDIQRHQYLVDQEEQRIEMNQRAITDFIEKLKLLDEDVQYLNATIRSDKIKAMVASLQETNLRNTMLIEARMHQKKTTTTIEGYSKSASYVTRLNDLQAKIQILRKREAIWSWIRNWGPACGKYRTFQEDKNRGENVKTQRKHLI
ncbi:hypothetical protein EC973_006982 [Apophysomyces ossiformis]|uniref:Uncharacterized protein n=1 Tax=Apophysomyces ossiformis TaxID=679940 RepID=A0A8H7BPX4_9FUNG|nr:hypothetical protein EC973_006982 [Apophysomyces ossiformis]